MKKRLLTLLAILLLCAGCRNREPEKLAIVSTLTLDGGNGGWQMTAEIAVAQGTDEKPQPVLFSADGTTLTGALKAAETHAGHPLWTEHACALALGRGSAKGGIAVLIQELMDMKEIPRTLRLLVMEESGASALETKPAMQKLAGTELGQLLSAGVERAEAPDTPLYRLCGELDAGYGSALPLAVRSEEKPDSLNLAGTALLHAGRMVGSLSLEETSWLLLLRGEGKKAILNLPEGVFEVKKTKRTVEREGAGARIGLWLQLCPLPDAEAALPPEARVQAACQAVLDRLQALSCDALGVGSVLGRWGGGWAAEFRDMPIALRVTVERAETVGEQNDG